LIGQQQFAGFARMLLGGEREIDLLLIEHLQEVERRKANERHAHAWPVLVEAPQNRRDKRGDDIMRHAQPDFALEVRRGHRRPHFVVQSKHPHCVTEQPLAAGRRHGAPGIAIDELHPKELFKAPDLLTDSGLSEVQRSRRAGHPARLDDGDEGAQQR
jgi:hypothetical protein